MKKILISKPNIDHNDLTIVNKATIDGWGNNYLFYNNKFEKNFSSYVGGKYCIATSSCTGATHIVLKSLNIKKNDEIILPNITWFSCASVINYMGAKPVFVDIDPSTLNLDPEKIESAITPNTTAIMPVHVYGNPCDVDAIETIAKKNSNFEIRKIGVIKTRTFSILDPQPFDHETYAYTPLHCVVQAARLSFFSSR